MNFASKITLIMCCEDVGRYVFDPHTSKAKSRLTITLIITPGFSRMIAGVFLARIWGVFCTSTGL
jgi:hypothetical protein